MTLVWKVLYEDGATVEEIALEFGVSTGYVRKSLSEWGTVMRSPGPKLGSRIQNRSNRLTDPVLGVHLARKGTRGVHRRRGNFA